MPKRCRRFRSLCSRHMQRQSLIKWQSSNSFISRPCSKRVSHDSINLGFGVLSRASKGPLAHKLAVGQTLHVSLLLIIRNYTSQGHGVGNGHRKLLTSQRKLSRANQASVKSFAAGLADWRAHPELWFREVVASSFAAYTGFSSEPQLSH